MEFGDFVTAASAAFTALGVLPIILAGGVFAVVGVIITKAKKVAR